MVVSECERWGYISCVCGLAWWDVVGKSCSFVVV